MSTMTLETLPETLKNLDVESILEPVADKWSFDYNPYLVEKHSPYLAADYMLEKLKKYKELGYYQNGGTLTDNICPTSRYTVRIDINPSEQNINLHLCFKNHLWESKPLHPDTFTEKTTYTYSTENTSGNALPAIAQMHLAALYTLAVSRLS